jgi:hypothetical protein
MTAQPDSDIRERLEELAGRFTEACESAVNPLEVASALEFDGISDRTARATYDVPDVFALARLLYERVPRKPAPPAAQADPWQTSRPLLHGLLYALPAVCFPAAETLLVGPGVLGVLIIALTSGWGLSQGLAAVGYLRLGTSGPVQARLVLGTGLACCLIAVALITVTSSFTLHARLPVLAFGAGEGVYMLSACVLMVTGEERWLPAALAPGVTAATVFLVLGKPADLQYQTWAALAATPLLACMIAVIRTSGRQRAERPGRRFGRSELLHAGPAALLGVILAGLLSVPAVEGVSGHGGGNVGAVIVSVPLALSMGAAEWSLLRYRRTGRRLLWLTDDLRWFRGRMARQLLVTLAQYMSATIALVSLAISVALLSDQVSLSATLLLSVVSFLLLGASMFLVLLLQAVRIRLVPITAAAVALCAELVLRRYGLEVQIAAPAALLAVVSVCAFTRLGETVIHA